MLSGEHAVLRGYAALVAATQHRVTVRLKPRLDDVITIDSVLGTCEMRLETMQAERPFHFAGAAIEAASGRKLATGFDLSIEAGMPPDVGLGSSAAVTVAVYAAVSAHIHGAVPGKPDLWRASRDIIRSVQGIGSGADAAASIYGGVVLYRQADGVLEEFRSRLPEVSLFYVGYKTPTAEVVDIVAKARLQSPGTFHDLDLRMEEATRSAADALRNGDMRALGKCLRDGQEVMRGYGVCDTKMDELMDVLSGQTAVFATKISGSGLGDCVLALGKVGDPCEIAFREIPVAIGLHGVQEEVS